MNEKDSDNRIMVDLQGMWEKVFEQVKVDEVNTINDLDYAMSNRVRMERALSWVRREAEMQMPDPDISFILLWIAFESLYSSEDVARNDNSKSTHVRIKEFTNAVIDLDNDDSLATGMENSWDNVQEIFGNKFLNGHCWKAFYDGPTKSGKRHKPFEHNETEKKKKSVLQDKTQLKDITHELFSRLYYLRNQVFHGNASYKGSEAAERSEQINQGNILLRNLIPVIIQIMLNSMEVNRSTAKWNKIAFPRISKD